MIGIKGSVPIDLMRYEISKHWNIITAVHCKLIFFNVNKFILLLGNTYKHIQRMSDSLSQRASIAVIDSVSKYFVP